MRVIFSFHFPLAQLRELWSEQSGFKESRCCLSLFVYVSLFFLRQRRTFISPTTLTHNHCASPFVPILFSYPSWTWRGSHLIHWSERYMCPHPRDEIDRLTSRLARLAGWLTDRVAHSEVSLRFFFTCCVDMRQSRSTESFVDWEGQWAPFLLCLILLPPHEWIARMCAQKFSRRYLNNGHNYAHIVSCRPCSAIEYTSLRRW